MAKAVKVHLFFEVFYDTMMALSDQLITNKVEAMKQTLRIFALLSICMLWAGAVDAQTNTVIAVRSDFTDVETGQSYPVSVTLQDITDVWQINIEIEYDPTLVYVVGTVAGSPMASGDFFGDESALVIRNTVNGNRVIYTHSLLSPAEPMTGSGTVATFQIYPLSAGTTQIRFSVAELTKVTYTESEDGSRDIQSRENLPVLPALLELNITGETVPPPDESTATPVPTPTLDAVGRALSERTEEPELVNVTLAPETPEPLTLIPDIEDEGGFPILPLAIGLLVVGLGGGILLFILSRRR